MLTIPTNMDRTGQPARIITFGLEWADSPKIDFIIQLMYESGVGVNCSKLEEQDIDFGEVTNASGPCSSAEPFLVLARVTPTSGYYNAHIRRNSRP